MDEQIDRYFGQLLRQAEQAKEAGHEKGYQEMMQRYQLKHQWWRSLDGGKCDNKAFLDEFEYA